MSVKELRERTQAGFMDCKKAWDESNGDMNVALEILKKRGLSKAEKRAGMDATEGAVIVSKVGDVAAMAFFGTETDFVAKNDEFCKFANDELASFLKSDIADLKDLDLAEPFSNRLAYLIGKIGENIVLKNCCKVKEEVGTKVFTYLHNKLNDNFVNVAKIGVVLKVKGECEDELGKQLAMHLASFRPQVLRRDQLSAENQNAGKEAVFEEQAFLMDTSKTIKALCQEKGIEIVEFFVFSVK